MKLVAIFLLLTCSSQIQIQAQRSDFVDYLLQLQYATDPLYYYMLDYFNDARRELSSLLTELNDASVMEIIDGLRAVISIRDRVEEAAAGSGSTACVNETLSNWNTELETVGNEISHCVDSDLDQLNADVIRIHNFLLENNNLKFETQNMVLSVFTELNPLVQADQITPSVSDRIDVIESTFNSEVKQGIDEILADIQRLRVTIPEGVHSCVNESISRFNNTAFDLIESINAC